MENPATWGPAEHAVQDVLDRYRVGQNNEVCGLSLARQITDALREQGLLNDTTEHVKTRRRYTGPAQPWPPTPPGQTE